MNVRERILLAAMVGAVGWGAGAAVTSLYRKSRTTGPIEDQVRELKEFAAITRQSVAATEPSAHERQVIEKAESPWANSPFTARAAPAAAVAFPAESAREPAFKFTGYVRQGDRSIAILNGREYRIAEAIPSTDFVVQAIETDRVVLTSKSGGRQIIIALEGAGEVKGAP